MNFNDNTGPAIASKLNFPFLELSRRNKMWIKKKHMGRIKKEGSKNRHEE
jgi:hypothetical protein